MATKVFAASTSLLIALAVAAVQPVDPDQSCRSLCDLDHPDRCDTLECKVPAIIPQPSKAKSIETGMDDDTKLSFELGVGTALEATRMVQWVVRQFGARAYHLVETFAMNNGTSFDQALLEAFFGPASDPWGSPNNAGFVGNDTTAMKTALLEGNIREVLALLYLLTETKWLDHVLLTGLPSGWDDTTLLQLGLVPAVVRSRYALVNRTLSLPQAKHYNGFPSFCYPPFDSWVRFDFAGPDESSTPPQWLGVRVKVKPHCNQTTLMSDDPLIQPPLSRAELQYQCGVAARCRLQWWPGSLCYTLIDTPFRQPPQEVAGYLQRTGAVDWRVAAGPSGSTSDLIQIGRMLGMDERLVRIGMLAWMIGTRDHSMFEILLGGDAYMPLSGGWRLNMTLADFGSIMSEDIKLDGGELFKRSELWGAVVDGWLLGTQAGKQIFAQFDAEQAAFIRSLSQREPGQTSVGPQS